MVSVKAGNGGNGIIIEIEGEPKAVSDLSVLLGVETALGPLSKELFGAVFFAWTRKKAGPQ